MVTNTQVVGWLEIEPRTASLEFTEGRRLNYFFVGRVRFFRHLIFEGFCLCGQETAQVEAKGDIINGI